MYLLNVSQLIQTQFWGIVDFNRPVWTIAPELQSRCTCRHPRNPPGDSPVNLLSLGNLAELKDCAWPHGCCGQSWEPQCGEVSLAVHSIGLVTSGGAVPPHREQFNFSSANSRLVAPMKLQVKKLWWAVAVLHPGSHGLQPSDVCTPPTKMSNGLICFLKKIVHPTLKRIV